MNDGDNGRTTPGMLCYCFAFRESDIQRQVAEQGHSDIPTRIAAEIRAGRCACAVKNPSGRCCLGDVYRALDDALAARGG